MLSPHVETIRNHVAWREAGRELGGIGCDTSVGFQIMRRLAGFCPPPPFPPVVGWNFAPFLKRDATGAAAWRGEEGTEGEMELTDGESGPLRPVCRYQSHP